MGNLSHLQPERVFYYFEEISKIPHGSYNTKALSDYCAAFAMEHKLCYSQDHANNIVIYKKASPGYETVPTVILQGHLDMVCEKESDFEFDFEKDVLKLFVDGDFLLAEKTTLGGDDGIAVALCLAILEDESLQHPALEVLFTSEEEVGLLGADAFDTGKISGHYFINLDSEEENTLTCGCAGGVRMDGRIPLKREEYMGVKYQLALKSFLGGHSGMEIDKWHINPCILMGRLLCDLSRELSYRLGALWGGLKDNAIPREAFAEIYIEKEKKEEFEHLFSVERALLIAEFSSMEPEMEIILQEQEEASGMVLLKEEQEKALFFLQMAPVGVQAMSGDIPGLVETSLNLGVLKLEDSALEASFALRSSKNTARRALEEKVERFIVHFEGGCVSKRGEYPAWEFRKTSKLRDLCTEVYRTRYEKEMKVEAIHAGLECGIFSEKIKDLDCVSLGADVFDVHTPKERLSISSTERTYAFLCEILKLSKDFL